MRKKFKPQEDITAYELALAIDWMNTALHAKRLTTIESHWDELPDNAKRHFIDFPGKTRDD